MRVRKIYTKVAVKCDYKNCTEQCDFMYDEGQSKEKKLLCGDHMGGWEIEGNNNYFLYGQISC